MNDSDLYKLRHSLSHVMAMAVKEVFPEAKLAIGPPVDNGFYYDFELPRSVSPEDLADLQVRMEKIIATGIDFVQSEVSADEAKALFAGQPYKLELIDELAEKGEKITLYTSGDFVDLCAGPHLDSTKQVPKGSFKLSHTAGAYWRGSELRPMLQRLYGLAFESKEALDAYIEQQEEAKKRDHRKLGAELDLFTFSDLVGPGLPLWTPKGNTLRLLLDDYVWSLRRPYGYERVEIPHITKKDLYEKSGHWEKFQHELFKIQTREGHEFVMKPMNCPHHTQIFARRKWSYREMPQRYANTTMCYRDEQTGELSGLSRVRALCQDDAHVFCRHSQAKDELMKIWNIVEKFYATFGFSLKLRLSVRDPKNPQDYLGDPKNWDKAEQMMRELAEEKGMDYFVGEGEAAFYAPKLDFMAYDSLGRQWQVATIQLDMVMPTRFGLTCTNEQGEEEGILMIHAAIMGSIDRFLSVLIEHFAGAFPFWLSPVQVVVASVSDQFNDAATKVAQAFWEAGIRAEADVSAESVGKKVRNATLQKVPLKVVIGAKEAEQFEKDGVWTIVPNWRQDLEGTEQPSTLPEAIHSLAKAASSRSF